MYKKSLFIFRRDLRLEDNIGLIEALQNSTEVIPCFIYDENIIKNLSDSKFRWSFLNESLLDLDLQLKEKGTRLQVLKGMPEKAIDEIIKKYKIEAIFLNTDFRNKKKKRDEKIYQICKKNKIPNICFPKGIKENYINFQKKRLQSGIIVKAIITLFLAAKHRLLALSTHALNQSLFFLFNASAST